MRRILFLPLFFLAGCASSSHISQSWQKPALAPLQPARLVVFCVTPPADSTLRVLMEGQVAEELRKQGVRAWPSAVLYGRTQFAGASWDSVYQRLRADSVDAVIAVVLRGEVHGAQTLSLPQRAEHYQQWRFEGYLRQAREEAVIPSTVAYTNRSWECTTYNLANRELLSTVQTESFDPGSLRQLATDYSRLLATHLLATGVLRP